MIPSLRLSPQQTLDIETLSFVQAPTRARGALDAALRRGLFAAEFGASYYRGFVDHADDLVAVDVPEVDVATAPTGEAAGRGRAAEIAGVASGLLAVSAGVLGAVAWQARRDFDGTTLEGPAVRDADRYRLTGTLAISALVAAALTGCLASYLSPRDAPR